MISSNNLYHFTPEYGYLKSIITEKRLRVSYCLEDYSWIEEFGISFNTIWGKERNRKQRYVAIPMTCFCDIPSNLILDHIMVYGNYGIKFNKSFREKIAVNPLFYLNSNSSATTILQTINFLSDRISRNAPEYALRNQIEKLLSYYKPYEGEFKKLNYENKEHIFYDEREWRYVEPMSLHSPISLKEFEELESKCIDYLKFDLDDIEVVIVKGKGERNELCHYLPIEKIELLEDFTKNQR